uniref:G-protein coupled receptors family 2 profile 1 domain-containing protein n=1 Tax=Romanomermis culicivorax TaxID=13658 RepID=A0A915I9M1_ROMCU
MDNWLTGSYEECEDLLKRLNLPLSGPSDGSLYCNATWDTFLCWPATPAGQIATHRCPPLKGLDTEQYVEKRCHNSGRWLGTNDQDFDYPYGFTNYTACFVFAPKFEQMTSIAESAVSIEYVGLIFSFFAILIALFKSKSFPAYIQTQRRHILISLLILISLRILLFIDERYHWPWKYLFDDKDGSSIADRNILCKLTFAALEMTKIVPAVFLALESFSIQRAMNSDNGINYRARTNLMIGYGVPFATIVLWLFAVIYVNHRFERVSQKQLFYKVEEQRLDINYRRDMDFYASYCGLANLFSCFQPSKQNIVQFRNIAYLTTILGSFQGFAIAMIYLIWGRAQDESRRQVPINQ